MLVVYPDGSCISFAFRLSGFDQHTFRSKLVHIMLITKYFLLNKMLKNDHDGAYLSPQILRAAGRLYAAGRREPIPLQNQSADLFQVCDNLRRGFPLFPVAVRIHLIQWISQGKQYHRFHLVV